MAWWLLIGAGACEVAFATCLKYSENFRHVGPSLGFLFFATLSFAMLNRAIQDIPIGTAYAVWTGIGAFGTAVVGILFFKDDAGAARLALLAGLVGCTLGLQLLAHAPHAEPAAPAPPPAALPKEPAAEPPAAPAAPPAAPEAAAAANPLDEASAVSPPRAMDVPS